MYPWTLYLKFLGQQLLDESNIQIEIPLNYLILKLFGVLITLIFLSFNIDNMLKYVWNLILICAAKFSKINLLIPVDPFQ